MSTAQNIQTALSIRPINNEGKVEIMEVGTDCGGQTYKLFHEIRPTYRVNIMNESQIIQLMKDFIYKITTLKVVSIEEITMVYGLIPMSKLPEDHAKIMYDWYMDNK